MDKTNLRFEYGGSEREVSYICPKCFRSITTKIKRSIDFYIDRDQNTEDIDMIMSSNPVILSCEKCEAVMFECDPKFVDRIIKLNSYGFKTLYCCEGHIDTLGIINVSTMRPEYDIATPYITFDYSVLSDKKIESLSIIMHKYTSEDKIFVAENDINAISVYPTGLNEDTCNLTLYEKEQAINEARNKLFEFIDCLIESAIMTNFKLKVGSSEVILNKVNYRNLNI